ncbi:MAG: alpha-amylase family glycosyl hydrolase [Bacteroidales bacterium]|nr:alpha-amylase family glycosyl hydrolase [Bacteroidales bacterium]
MKKISIFFAALLCVSGLYAKTIYLNTGGSACWGADNPAFFAHSWEGSDFADSQMTLVSGDVYSASVPDAHTSIIFVRMPSGSTSINWDTKWNRTGDLTIPTDGKNCYTMTSWMSDNSGNVNASWTTYSTGGGETGGGETGGGETGGGEIGNYTSSVPSQCPDVMLQAFYWDSNVDKGYGDTKWTTLNAQASEIAAYFDLVWLPPSAKSSGGVGYLPKQYSNQTSDWGTRAELEKFIAAMHAGNTKVIADIVINHAGNKSSWCDFFKMDFGEYGVFEPDASWITRDDEVWSDPSATGCTVGAGASYDDGQDSKTKNYGAARDWDHNNAQVREMCRAYLKWMKNEMHYDGWRYDYCKGFHESHINEYNTASQANFSVMEWWDGNPETLKAAIGRANNNTLTFDFATKYDVFQNAMAHQNYQIKGKGLLGAGYSKYAVTFIDSHDSFGRKDAADIMGKNDGSSINNKSLILQCNAYILSMPGIPCVFYPHWVKYKEEIKPMIMARKLAGVHSESAVSDEAAGSYYKATITGKTGSIIMYLGSAYNDAAPSGYTLACKDAGYAVYYKTTLSNTVSLTVTPASGTYDKAITVSMAAASAGTPTIYYTLDGTEPSAASTKYTAPFAVDATTTLKAIAISGSSKSEVVTREYVIEKPVEEEPDPMPTTGITVRFRIADECNWDLTQGVSYWMWHDKTDGKFVKADKTGSWYTYTFPEGTVTPFNIIALNGDDWGGALAFQTDDIEGVSESTCYYVTSKGPGVEGDSESWKRRAIAVDCNYVPDALPTITRAAALTLCPNPTKGTLAVNADSNIARIEIYSCMGALVATHTAGTPAQTIDVTGLQNGMYILRATLENGTTSVGKFVKQ